MSQDLSFLTPENLHIKKHSIKLYGHSTSVTLEAIFWDQLKILAVKNGMSLRKLIEQIDAQHPSNLSSALRVYVLKNLME